MSVRAYTSAQQLDQRVRVERCRRDANGDVSAWLLVGYARARVDGQKATAEPEAQGGTRSAARYTVWLRSDIMARYRITPADRLVWKQRQLNILDAADQGLAGRFVPLVCEAGINRG